MSPWRLALSVQAKFFSYSIKDQTQWGTTTFHDEIQFKLNNSSCTIMTGLYTKITISHCTDHHLWQFTTYYIPQLSCHIDILQTNQLWQLQRFETATCVWPTIPGRVENNGSTSHILQPAGVYIWPISAAMTLQYVQSNAQSESRWRLFKETDCLGFPTRYFLSFA